MADNIKPEGSGFLPEDLSTVSDADLATAKEKILAAFDKLDTKGGRLTADEMTELGRLADEMKAARAEEAARAEADAAADAHREALRMEMTGDTTDVTNTADVIDTDDTDGDDAVVIDLPTPNDTINDDTEGHAPAVSEDTDVTVETLVAALKAAFATDDTTTDAPVGRPAVSTEVADRSQGLTIVASSDIPGVSVGSNLDSTGLYGAIGAKARALGDSKGAATRYPVASVEKNTFTHDLRGQRSDVEIMATWKAAHDSTALVASGGWCAPVETVYDFGCDFESLPDAVDLPTIAANRSGVRVPEPLLLGDILGQPGIGMDWTEADDIAAGEPGGPVKVCFQMPCPGFLPEVKLGAHYTCVTAGNLTDRAWPELTSRTQDLALVAHAHRMNAEKIQRMVAASTAAPVTVAAGISATEAILGSLEFLIGRTQDQFFMSEAEVIEVVLPRWARRLIRRDIARRSGVDFRNVSNATIDAYFAEIGASVQFVTNWQMLANNATAYPANVQALVYPSGTFTHLDFGTLDISVVRDSVLNSTNDHTLLFFEEFWAILAQCASFIIDVPVCANGATGAPVDLICPTV